MTLVTTKSLNAAPIVSGISYGAKIQIYGTTNYNGSYTLLTANNSTDTYTFAKTGTIAQETAGTAAVSGDNTTDHVSISGVAHFEYNHNMNTDPWGNASSAAILLASNNAMSSTCLLYTSRCV